MRHAAIIISIVVAVLAGCAVGPDYQAPKTSTPPQWTSSLNGGETNGPADLARWWQNFNDTNLDTIMLTAPQSNLTLKIAEARVREARAQRGVISAGLWPHLDGSASYTRNHYSAHAFPPLADFGGVPLDYNL